MREMCPDCSRIAILHSWMGEKRVCLTCLGGLIRKQDSGTAGGPRPAKGADVGDRFSDRSEDSSKP